MVRVFPTPDRALTGATFNLNVLGYIEIWFRTIGILTGEGFHTLSDSWLVLSGPSCLTGKELLPSLTPERYHLGPRAKQGTSSYSDCGRALTVRTYWTGTRQKSFNYAITPFFLFLNPMAGIIRTLEQFCILIQQVWIRNNP